jgi:L-rhamnose-H+ transport protein
MIQVLLGIFLHGIGAISATFCYMPQKKTTRWSWQSYWLAQAFICWLVLPIFIAWLTIPHLGKVIHEVPGNILFQTFFFGAVYGIAGNAFGVAIRYIGFSLTYTVTIGMSVVLGTICPLLYTGELVQSLSQIGGEWIIAGMGMGLIGLILFGVAGRNKEVEQNESVSNFKIGMWLCILVGIFNWFLNLSFSIGQPLADAAAKYGAGNLQSGAIYLFSLPGAFLTTLIYTVYLHTKHHTSKEYLNGNVVKGRTMLIYQLMALFSGMMWYGQFLFYGLGHNQLGKLKFSSWAIHMVMLVLFSGLAGLILKEWKLVKPKTLYMLFAGLFTLIISVLFLTYGNYLGM